MDGVVLAARNALLASVTLRPVWLIHVQTLGGLCLLRLPVFQSQRRNSRKLSGIVRHQRQVVSKGDGGDLEIVRPDRFSPSLERTTDLGALHRTGVIER